MSWPMSAMKRKLPPAREVGLGRVAPKGDRSEHSGRHEEAREDRLRRVRREDDRDRYAVEPGVGEEGRPRLEQAHVLDEAHQAGERASSMRKRAMNSNRPWPSKRA